MTSSIPLGRIFGIRVGLHRSWPLVFASTRSRLSATDVHRGFVLDADLLARFLSMTDLTRALEVRAPDRERLPRAA